jgi:hypothetical protein
VSSFDYASDTRASFTTLDLFETTYVSHGHEVWEVDRDNAITTPPLVEKNEAFVGTILGIKSPYHPDLVAQLSAWPAAKFFLYFKGVLFAANLKENGGAVRWSAAIPAHRVWPEESIEFLTEGDAREITGLSSLTEFPVVFKRDSIWNMVYIGPSPSDEGGSGGVPQYSPVKVVSGIGTEGGGTTALTPRGLLFAGDDGVYLYKGTPLSEEDKLSGAIDKMWRRINPSKRKEMRGVYWPEKQAYLLSVAIDGAEFNNMLLVYDLKHKAWWFWEDFEAQELFLRENGQTQEVYFEDHLGRLYQ